MENLLQKMNDYCEQTCRQSVEMSRVLVSYIKSKGGRIDTSNPDGRKDNLYIVVYDGTAELNTSECKVDSVRVVEDEIQLHIEDGYEDDEQNWFSLMSDTIINSTIYNLCEVLPEYD